MNIYLISANSYRIINTEIKKITKDQKYSIINYNNSSIKDIINEVNSLSLFSDKRVTVISNCSFFGKDKLTDKDANLLLDYFEKPNKNNITIFTMLDKVDKRKKITKIVEEKYKLIEILPWDKKSLREHLKEYLDKYNYQIDYDTSSFIIDNSLDNIDILFNELDKIMLYYNKPCFIKLADVKNIVGSKIDNNIWHFINNVILKNLEESVKLLQDLKVYKIDSTSLVILLYREYKLMYLIKNINELDMDSNAFAKNYNLRDWQIDNIYKNSLSYSNQELLRNISLLADLDYKIKSGIYDKDTALYPFLLSVCI